MSAWPQLQATSEALQPATATAPRQALRFLTAGSVDDGKSTLIGRLLYDSRAILADQLDTLEKKAAGAPIDLSLLTDGLEAEREQGITIDVAYRYFATKRRKFIIADAHGHEQYTRNMVTAAAGSDAAVVLVDITKFDLSAKPVQLLPQTRRHALLAHLLRVPSIVFAINKLDAVDQPQAAYAATRAALLDFCAQAGMAAPAGMVPVSALRGDNVALPLSAPWYDGPTLLQLLEGLPAGLDDSQGPFRLPVQWVAREASDGSDGTGHQPRTFWGRVAHGTVRTGDFVQVFPSGVRAQVVKVRRAHDDDGAAQAGESAGLVLDRQVDVSRGDWIGAANALPATQRVVATLAWLDVEPAVPGRRYWVRHAHRWCHARISAIHHRLNIHTLEQEETQALQVNEIGEVELELQQPLPLVPYAEDRTSGALIVVDPSTHRTSGALLVHHAQH